MKSFYKILPLALSLLFIIETSAQEMVVFKSSNLKCNDTVLVFTPKNRDSNTPLLYLLHGWSGGYADWSNKTNLQHFSDKYGFIIVTPDGFYNSWYLNNIDSSKMQWRDFFDKELYPTISLKYGVSPKRTFITGLSMGGHGALNIFIDDISRFAASGSMSGVLNLHDTRLKENQINEVLGPYSSQNLLFDSSSAINRLERIKESNKMMIISCGYDDSLLESSINFAKRCRELKINHSLMISPGAHSWNYWVTTLDHHLFFFSKLF